MFPAGLFESIAQQSIPDSSFRADSVSLKSYISVVSSPERVRIYIDSLFSGFAPRESIKVTAGRHILRFVHPDNSDWSLRTVTKPVSVNPYEHITVQVKFPGSCHITTNPFGADLNVGDSLYGRTPFILPVAGESIIISLSKERYNPIAETVDRNLPRIHFDLQRSGLAEKDAESAYLQSVARGPEIPLYISAGTTVLAGAAAAYFKIKADNRYSEYQKRGDPGALDRVRRLDRAAGVSLIISEMSFFLLSYLLISR